MKKTLREVLHQADPGLKIISGGIHPRGRYRLSEQDWEIAAGVICRRCGREVFRSRDGLCMSCWEKENEFVIFDRCGVSAFLPRDIIMEICRKPKNS